MLSRILTIAVSIAACTLPGQAHPQWMAQTETILHWQVRHALDIPVHVHVVRWAEIYFADPKIKHVTLSQSEEETDHFEGCIDLLICVNFPGLKITATYVVDKAVADAYFVSLVHSGEMPEFMENQASLTIKGVHCTGNKLPVTLCVRAVGVTPGLIGTSADEEIAVGAVALTMVPTGSPV